jgi:hypothetical protein
MSTSQRDSCSINDVHNERQNLIQANVHTHNYDKLLIHEIPDLDLLIDRMRNIYCQA